MSEQYRNDLPSKKDALNRETIVNALTELARTCATPMVVGLYGTWGTGKTSLMEQIEEKLRRDNFRTVWFNPWEHQFNEMPALSLLQKVVSDFDKEKKYVKSLTVVASAFASKLSSYVTGLNAHDIIKLGEHFERENFQAREVRDRLKKFFEEVIKDVRGESNARIIFFIDDLDRCMPEQVMSMIEALKLFLHLSGCVYFLGVDHNALEKVVTEKHGSAGITGTDYLDKIVQIPFHIPAIAPDSMSAFVEPMLIEELKKREGLVDILVRGMGDNPRKVKRFINVLTLDHHLAKETINAYQPEILALMLMIQQREPRLYKELETDPNFLNVIRETLINEENPLKVVLKTQQVDHWVTNASIRTVLEWIETLEIRDLSQYIYLTRLAGVEDEGKSRPSPEFMKALRPSDALAAIVGIEPLPRTEVAKKIWAYIKKNNLQDKKNERMINADNVLLKIFEGKEKVSMFEMTKLINKHLSDS